MAPVPLHRTLSTCGGRRGKIRGTLAGVRRERRMTSRLFGQRDFRLLWLGESVSNTGTAVSGITLPLLAATTLHASTFDIGLLDAFLWLPWLLIGLPAG